MKKLTLIMLLLVSTNIFAEWTSVSDATLGDNNFDAYIDLKSIRKDGNKVQLSYLLDFTIVQKVMDFRYWSTVDHYEFDCSEETERQLDAYWYSENMMQGDVVESETNIKDQPKPITPKTINEIFFNIACSKK